MKMLIQYMIKRPRMKPVYKYTAANMQHTYQEILRWQGYSRVYKFQSYTMRDQNRIHSAFGSREKQLQNEAAQWHLGTFVVWCICIMWTRLAFAHGSHSHQARPSSLPSCNCAVHLMCFIVVAIFDRLLQLLKSFLCAFTAHGELRGLNAQSFEGTEAGIL
jgi:hypothetical protein